MLELLGGVATLLGAVFAGLQWWQARKSQLISDGAQAFKVVASQSSPPRNQTDSPEPTARVQERAARQSG